MQHGEATIAVAVPVCIACTLLRYLVNVIVALVWRKGETKEQDAKRRSVVEETWLLASSTVLLALSTSVSEYHNDKCSLLQQDGCFVDWPHQQNSTPVTIAIAVFLGWYVHCVIKSMVPGIGLHAGVDMVGHHILTLALLVFAHIFNVQRQGFFVLALLNISSPFMHCAKIAHHAGGRPFLKTALFLLFAAAFALSRCILFPRMLWSIVGTVQDRLASGQTEVILPAMVTMSGLGLLQVLQYYWMWRIIRVLMRGGMDSKHQHATPATPTAPLQPPPAAVSPTEPTLPPPSLAAHSSPHRVSQDGTRPLLSPPPAIATKATPSFPLRNGLTDNELDSPVAAGGAASTAYRRSKATSENVDTTNGLSYGGVGEAAGAGVGGNRSKAS